MSSSIQRLRRVIGQIMLPGLVMAIVAAAGVGLYHRSRSIMQEQLRAELKHAAALSAVSMDGDVIDSFTGPPALFQPAYGDMIRYLRNLRTAFPHIRYAYVMRRTDQPHILAFVGEADTLASDEELDRNGNGVVDPDEEATYPGESYDASDVPALLGPAFEAPVADEEITVDQWGALISGYAPIRRRDGSVAAVLGLDMTADHYLRLSTTVFSPVALTLLLLGGVLSAVFIQQTVHRRRMEAYAQLEAERSALLDLTTHQLGMPLATFKWWVEILRDQGDEKNADALKELEEGISRMDDIVASLEEASQLRGDLGAYVPTTTNLSSAVRRVLADMDDVIRRHRATVALDLPAQCPSVMIDRQLFHGVLREILHNAVSYGSEGSTVRLAVRVTDKKHVEIDVTDHGCGIPADDLPYVFDKFRRGSNAAVHRPVGNGLGLFIAQRVMEKAGGSIRIESRLNEGTTVTLRLPVKHA